jgi:hypothetical protein
MADAYFLVQSNALPGREEEFHTWYEETHVPDLLAIPGFVAVQRFRLSDARPVTVDTVNPYGYLAIYEIEGDPQEALNALGRARDAGMFISPAFDPNASTFTVTPIGPRVVKGE